MGLGECVFVRVRVTEMCFLGNHHVDRAQRSKLKVIYFVRNCEDELEKSTQNI